MSRKSILDLKHKLPVPPSLKPVRRAQINATVEKVADIDALRRWYGAAYAAQYEKAAGLENGKREDEFAVTLRPAFGGHVVIINRFRWIFLGVEGDFAVLGGRGHIKSRIKLEDWRKLCEKAGVDE